MNTEFNMWKVVRPSHPASFKQEALESELRMYLVNCALYRPSKIKFNTTPRLLKSDLKLNWLVSKNAEPEAKKVRDWLEKVIKQLTHNLSSRTNLHVVINIGPDLELVSPLPNAPAVCALFDATHGIVRHRLIGSGEVYEELAGEAAPIGLSLLCQPFGLYADQMPTDLNQGGNLFMFNNNELNQWGSEIHMKLTNKAQLYLSSLGRVLEWRAGQHIVRKTKRNPQHARSLTQSFRSGAKNHIPSSLMLRQVLRNPPYERPEPR